MLALGRLVKAFRRLQVASRSGKVVLDKTAVLRSTGASERASSTELYTSFGNGKESIVCEDCPAAIGATPQAYHSEICFRWSHREAVVCMLCS